MTLDILRIITDVSSPLGVAGLVLVVLTLIVRNILRLPIFPKLERHHTVNLLTRLLNKTFSLALTAIVLGFTGFVATQYFAYQSLANPITATFSRKLRLPLYDIHSVRYVSPSDTYLFNQHYDQSALFEGRLGDPVVAIASGVVRFEGVTGRCGRTVIIEHGNDLKSIYCHLQRAVIQKGSLVQPGTKIGELGMTGMVSGPYLRLALKIGDQPVDALSTLLSNMSE